MSDVSQLQTIYQLRFVLAGVSPMIWRRLLVSSGTNIAQLHEYVQIAFDWTGEHLHRFHIHGKDYGIAYLGGISFDDNPRDVLLCRFGLHAREAFRYEYDFTARWRVDIRLETVLPGDQQQQKLPVCTAGQGAGPGEEYGGALAYMQRLAGRQPLGASEELREAVARVTEYQEFQPRRCDRRSVNRRLRALSHQGVAA
jgi:hypothetical protein